MRAAARLCCAFLSGRQRAYLGSHVVTRSLTQPGQYTGMFPIDGCRARWEKNAATLKQLHSLRERISALEQALKAGERKNNSMMDIHAILKQLLRTWVTPSRWWTR